MRASVRSRSRPFAQTGCLQGFSPRRANASEPERTPNLAILATEPDAESDPVSFSHACAAVQIELEAWIGRRRAHQGLDIEDEFEAPGGARQRFAAQRFDDRPLRGLADARGADCGDVEVAEVWSKPPSARDPPA